MQAAPARSPARPPPEPPGFAEFWAAYPKKRAREDALKAWVKLRPDADLLRTILRNVGSQRDSADWRKDGGQFVPLPATYLRGRRWEDETPAECEFGVGAV